MSFGERSMWHEQLPSGATIEYIGPDQGIVPDEREADERELVSLVSMEGYGMGIERREFQEMMAAWISHEGSPDAGDFPPPTMPAEPEIRTHASNHRYGAAVRERFDVLMLTLESANTRPSVLRALETDTLRDLWILLNKMQKHIEATAKERSAADDET